MNLKGNYQDESAAIAHADRRWMRARLEKNGNPDDWISLHAASNFGALLYQGTGPHCEFNGLIIVSRTIAVVKHSNSSSKKLPGKNQSRNSPAVLPHVSLSICETIW